ncbi:hypothetical protein BD413DRAFT_607385 [Trametes elegans]|nr:hypothetical protein BD413DRAFT_607385 [Trametes elegans]
MAVPAKCENGANDPSSPHEPYQPNPNDPPANLAVVLSVLGGCSLVALLVAIVVPLARRRVHRRASIVSTTRSAYQRVHDGDVDVERDVDAHVNAHDGDMYLPSRRPSIRHQKMFAGPDAQPLLPLLLDPLRPLSTLTWSDLRSRSKSPGASTDSESLSLPMPDDDLPVRGGTLSPDAASLTTNRATTSHRSTGSSTRSEHWRRDEQGRPIIISTDDASGARPGAVPFPPPSPTPPGMPSKREYSIAAPRRASLPLPITPTSPADSNQARATLGMPLFAPIPSASASTSSVSALARHPSGRPRAGTQKPGMEPVLEDSAPDGYADSRSIQLPSPPASPEQGQPHWRGSLVSLNAPATPSSSTGRRRPSLTASQTAPSTAPSTMSYRPRSSTGPAIPLTAAFQTSVLRSGTQSTASSSHHRYPSNITSPSQAMHRERDERERTRPSSVASPERPRPAESFRRMSTTDIRHRRPSRAGDPGADAETRTRQQEEARAFVRTSEAARTTQGQLGSAAGFDPRASTADSGVGGLSFTTPPPNPLSPPALAPTPPRLSVHTRTPSNVTWRPASSGSYQQQQPALVRRKDSPALRPIPVSALMHPHSSGSSAGSSPLSPPSAGVAGLSLSGGRSRSNSVRSTRTLPVQGQGMIPPLEPVAPLTISTPEEDEEADARRW